MLLNDLQRTYDFICRHPLGSRHKLRAVHNWVGWQLRSRLSRGPHVVPFVGDTRLLVSRGMHGATGNIYCGLHEFEDMAFVLHFLRPGDLFVDVGANIGSYTILASGFCGARTLAVEPAPAAAAGLLANVQLNALDDLVAIERRALGRDAGTVRLSSGLDCLNHVMNEVDTEGAVEIAQITLDELLKESLPALLKIDVEGYECEVLAGALSALAQPTLKAVIVEVNGSGSRYGHADAEVVEILQNHGFTRVRYEPIGRDVSAETSASPATGNALFARDLSTIRARVSSAPLVHVMGQPI